MELHWHRKRNHMIQHVRRHGLTDIQMQVETVNKSYYEYQRRIGYSTTPSPSCSEIILMMMLKSFPTVSCAKELLSDPTHIISFWEVIHPWMKWNWSCLIANFNICNASIRKGLIQLHFFVSISALDEKTCSHGTADTWTGRMSIAM